MRYLIIFLLSLFIASTSYAKVTILDCKFVSGVSEYKDGRREYSTPEQFKRFGLSMDKRLKVDTRKEDIFEFFAGTFNSVKKFKEDLYMKWDDLQISWSYYVKGYSDTKHSITLDRSTGKLVTRYYHNKNSNLYKAKGYIYGEHVHDCQEAKKKF